MALSVNDLQSRMAAILDQNESVSAISSADYSLRLSYLNMAQQEWSEIIDWQVLYKEFNGLVSTASANASVAMPSDFRKPASQPVISFSSTESDSFLITLPQEALQYGSTQRRVEYLGNPFSGYVMRVYGTALVSGASVKVPYYSSPVSLASPTNISPVPNPDFLVKRAIAYWWEARRDGRFPSAKAEAQQILQNMIEHENVFPVGADYSKVRTVERTQNFRIGRD